jgi:arylsulfatase A-like enzyme
MAPHSAIRVGDYKLIRFYEDQRLELYDLASDPGEKNNLSKKQPEKTAELERRLNEYLNTVEAELPKPNPAYDPENPPILDKGRKSRRPKRPRRNFRLD